MIRFAKPGDHPRLKELWADVFGDSPEDIDTYFSMRHTDNNMLVYEQSGTIAGMLTMLPVTLVTDSGFSYSARYIYAVATDTRYRKQGISTQLLAAAHAHMQNAGVAASVLVPATPELFGFYEKRGYQTGFWLDIITKKAAVLPPVPPQARFAACSAAEYTRIRDAAFQTSSLYVRWQIRDVTYAMHTFFQHGGVSALSWDTGQGCAAWEHTQHGVLVRELVVQHGDMDTALSVLHSQLQAEQYILRLAQGTIPGATQKPFGMIHWLIPKPAITGLPPYLSLAMD